MASKREISTDVVGRSGLPHIKLPWAKNKAMLRWAGVVYYLERADGLIKIGCTQNYPQRRQTLVQRNGPLYLVAWEVGYYGLERQRHEQFAALRQNPAAEWFALDADLYDHMLMLLAHL